jgi:hypothetical protein
MNPRLENLASRARKSAGQASLKLKKQNYLKLSLLYSILLILISCENSSDFRSGGVIASKLANYSLEVRF